MKIAFYAPLKPISHPNPSGDRAIARGLYAYLTKRGHECRVLSEFRARWFYLSPRGIARAAGAVFRSLRQARRFRADICFTYHLYYKAPDLIGPVVSAVLKKPYVVFEAMYSTKPRGRLKTAPGYFLTRFALKRAAHVFTDKQVDHENLLRLLPAHRVTYIPPAVDVSRFDRDPARRRAFREANGIAREEVVITSVAMLRPDRKSEGVRFLLGCLGELRREGHRFRFVLVGGGPCLPEMRALCRRELAGRGVLLGTVDRARVVEALCAADLFAFPGIDEGFGLSYVEAQACHLPVVAFDNGGVPEAVDRDRSAFLTPLLDRQAYKEALRRLIIDESLRTRMGEAARAYVRGRHDQDANYSRMAAKIEELVNRP